MQKNLFVCTFLKILVYCNNALHFWLFSFCSLTFMNVPWTSQVVIHLMWCLVSGSSPSHIHQHVHQHQQVLSSLTISSDSTGLEKNICWTMKQQAAVILGKPNSKWEDYGF